MSPNHETLPQELIHFIAKRNDLHVDNSLNSGGSKVPSLAKMILHHDKTEGECSDDAKAKDIPKGISVCSEVLSISLLDFV